MAYFAPYIDESGLHVPTYVDIRDDLVAQFRQIYGDDLYLENDSQDYQMISAFASKTADTMALLQLVWNNHSPKTAVGTALSSLVKLNGIARKAASYSTCVLTITGRAGTVIRGGSVKDDQDNIWDLPATVTLTGDTTEVTAQCETLGAVEAAPGTITTINTPQAGWTAVTNAVPAVVGAPIETDAELRERQSISVAIPSQNMLESTIAGLKAIEGVTRAKVYDNDTSVTDENGIPSHSIAAVVEGGLDDEVAAAVYLRKGPGGGTYGTTTVTYATSDGRTIDISFFRPSYVTVDVDVRITPKAGYTSQVLDDIRANISAYFEALDIGTDVTVIALLKAITGAVATVAAPTFSLASLQMSESGEEMQSADISIPFTTLATAGNITVEVAGT